MKKWTVGVPDKKAVSALMLGCGVTSLAASALAAKGYSSPESVAESLNTDELSDPFLIKDMQKAADTINSAIENGERICNGALRPIPGNDCHRREHPVRYALYERQRDLYHGFPLDRQRAEDLHRERLFRSWCRRSSDKGIGGA